jgi:hypothetical protein
MNRRTLLLLAVGLVTQATVAGTAEETDCARIRSRLRDIRSRLRAGYTAKQGRRLREQERQLDERRRRECR